MAAAVRAGGFNKAKTQPRAPAKSAPRRSSKGIPRSKFHARANGSGISPKAALIGAMGAVVLAGAIALFTGDRLEKLGHAIGGGMASQLGKAGFKVTSLQIKGASPRAGQAIAQAVGVNRNDPILGLNLEEMRKRILAVGWVEKVSVVRMLPNTLVVEVLERAPAAVWQSGGVMRVIDDQGRTISEASAASFPELPLLVGVGANEASKTVLELVRTRPRLSERLEALVRVDERRWDLRLKSGTIIQLPAVGEDSALIQLDTLDKGEGVLDLPLERIDLRSPEMIVVRRRESAPVTTALVQEGV